MDTREHLERAVRRASRRARLPEPSLRRLIRERAGLTQEELAEALGVTRAALSRWESGRRNPRAANAIAYVDALDRLLTLSEGQR